jgi:hypothetical protein
MEGYYMPFWQDGTAKLPVELEVEKLLAYATSVNPSKNME